MNLILGIVFIAYGVFRIYQHLNENLTPNTIRLIIAIAFIGSGGYSIYKYFKFKNLK
ncbi:hypothetical protein [Olleya marilimosa]|uniref:hypothetical protein n=1 Tax=Olleya marilimosa TaxID=272164 RepID=UPI0030EC0781